MFNVIFEERETKIMISGPSKPKQDFYTTSKPKQDFYTTSKPKFSSYYPIGDLLSILLPYIEYEIF